MEGLHSIRSPPDGGLCQHIAAAVEQRPILGDMHMRRVFPIGVVDEQQAAGLEFRQRGAGADGAIPAVHHHEVERSVREIEDGGGIGRQRRVFERVGFGFAMVERHMAEFHIGNAAFLKLTADLMKPGGIAFDAGEVRQSSGKPQGTATAAPLEAAHVGPQVFLKPAAGTRCQPRVVRMTFFIPPVLETSREVERAEEIAQFHAVAV